MAATLLIALLLFPISLAALPQQTVDLYKLEKGQHVISINFVYTAPFSPANIITSHYFPLPFLHFATNTNFSAYEVHLVQGRWDPFVKQFFSNISADDQAKKSFKYALNISTYDGGLSFKAITSELPKIINFLGGFLCSGTDRVVKNMVPLKTHRGQEFFSADPMNYLCYDNMVHLFDLLKQQNPGILEILNKNAFGLSGYTQLDLAQEKTATHNVLSVRITFMANFETMLQNRLQITPTTRENIELRRFSGQTHKFIRERIDKSVLLSDYVTQMKPVKPLFEPLIINRYLTGVDHELYVTYVSIIRNTGTQKIALHFQENLPHFLRPYFHTLSVEVNGAALYGKSPFTPRSISYNSKSDCYVDLGLIELNPDDEVKITLQIEKLLLPFEEYTHDSSRGFDIPSMIFEYADQDGWHETYVPSIVLMLPQPDFSMPFNVHALYCVVIGVMFKLYLTIIDSLS